MRVFDRNQIWLVFELSLLPPGDPGERAHGVYFAYFRDLDGNKLCALYRVP